jgi:DNA-binding response OmpR family regulator
MNREFILIVDDERDICSLVQEILEDEGFEVVVAESADAAREARRARKPDLVLLDIWMPDTDGITLLKEWSENSGPDTPVITISLKNHSPRQSCYLPFAAHWRPPSSGWKTSS